MTSEEIHLNPALEQAGIEVTETDFGEYIIQVAGERPSHLVAPAVHHTRESMARVLSKHLGEQLADDPQSLAMTGRRVLREKFRRADLGITGANFAVAETGTVVLVTNEGNGRLTTTCAAGACRDHGHREGDTAFHRSAGVLEIAGPGGDGANAVGLHDVITGLGNRANSMGRRNFIWYCWIMAARRCWRRRSARACSASAAGRA